MPWDLLLKRYRFCVAAFILSCSTVNGTNAGLLGGIDFTPMAPPFPPAAYILTPAQTLTMISLPQTYGIIRSVAINSMGMGLMGGQDLGTLPPIAFLVSSSGLATSLSLSQANGVIASVAINSLGSGIIGGQDLGSLPPIAYLVSSTGGVTAIPFSQTNGRINSVAINDAGLSLIGGTDFTPAPDAPIASFVSSGNVVTPIVGLSATGAINSVAINLSGLGLIGGNDGNFSAAPLAYQVSLASSPVALGPLPTAGNITSVAINSSGEGLIGGVNQTGPITPLAYRVSPTGAITPVTGLPTLGGINSVAINSSGVGLMGGDDFLRPPSPSAMLVPVTGPAIMLGPLPSIGTIRSVAINDAGFGLIGGENQTGGTFPLAYLVTPSGTLVPLAPLSTLGGIYSVALAGLSQISTAGLTDNNLEFATYINTYASSLGGYFIPASVDGTLPQALQSAAPTRNAFSVIAIDDILFKLNHSLSRHLRKRRMPPQVEMEVISSVNLPSNRLLALNEEVEESTEIHFEAPEHIDRGTSYEIWAEILAVTSHNGSQHQCPQFQPISGGAIAAFEASRCDVFRIGGGAAYAFTHIHQHHGMGNSNINQEYLFAYGEWSDFDFYIDGGLWGGLFQVKNLREIHMTGFDFTTRARFTGWQLCPHLEFGYDADFCKQSFTLEPFAMFDWINNWQHRYKENGNSPFNAVQKEHYSSFLRSEVGLRFYETIDFNCWRLVLEEKASYVNKKPFKLGVVNGALVGFPGSFALETFTSMQNLVAVEFQMLFEPANSAYPYGSIDYQGEFGSKYQSHQLSASIGYDF